MSQLLAYFLFAIIFAFHRANAQCVNAPTIGTGPCGSGGNCTNLGFCCASGNGTTSGNGTSNSSVCCQPTAAQMAANTSATASACGSVSNSTSNSTSQCPTGQTQTAPIGGTSNGTNGTNCLGPATCPTGSSCVYSSTAATYICCTVSSVATSQCPGGTKQALATNPTSTSLTSTICLNPFVCPSSYHCTYSSTAQNYICCQAACANGAASIAAQSGSQTSNYCLASYNCPNGYKCTYTAAVGNYLCCPSSG